MANTQLTVWEQAQQQGHSRRDFLQFCTWLCAAAGIEASAVGQVVHALETKPRIPVVWVHFQECTCCSESFIRSSHPIVSDIILDKISSITPRHCKPPPAINPKPRWRRP